MAKRRCAGGRAVRADGAGAATIRRDLNVASMVVEAAITAGMVPDAFPNPFPRARKTLTERREPVEPVPVREIALTLRDIEPAGLRAMARFLARVGCRQEEAAGLEWEAIRLGAREVTFARTKTRAPRLVTISPQAARDLARLEPDPAKRQGIVFRKVGGGRFLQVPTRWLAAAKVLWAARPGARRFRCHDLRHTWAIQALRAGRDIYSVSRHLGHSTVPTTEVYLAWLARAPD